METEETKTVKKSRSIGLWIGIAALAAIIIGGIIYVVMSLTRGTELSEMDAWARVGHFQATGELDSMEVALNEYLWTFSDGRYVEDARTLRDRLNRERDEWNRVLDYNCNLKAVDEYIYAHPDGFFHTQALLLLDSLEFLDAKEKNTEEALLTYLAQQHDGRFVKEAQALLKAVGKVDASEEETKQAAALIKKHFAAMQEGSETIVTTMADIISSYIGKPNPSISDVLAYMNHFHKGNDTKELSVTDFNVKKMMSGNETMYSVQFLLKETINPEDSASAEVKNLKGTAILDAAMLMTSLVLEKQ